MTQNKHSFVVMSRSGQETTTTTTAHSSRKNKKIILILFSSLLIVAAVIGTVATVKNSKNEHNSANHAIIKSSCSTTSYPDLCFSSLTKVSRKFTSQKDVIMASLNVTFLAVEHTYFHVKKLLLRKGLTLRQKTALHDCLEMVDETLDELRKAEEELKDYPGNKKKLSEHADDLLTLVSSAITNQETCRDGFSSDKADKHVREALEEEEKHLEKMCSNALAMIKNMTDTDIATQNSLSGRKLKEDNKKSEWPEWLSAGDRRLLQASTVTPNVVVAADGSGNYKTVSAAVAAAPTKSSKRYVIRIKAGVYRENVDIPKGKTNIMLVGDNRKTTIITANRNVVDGSTTFHSATVAAVGAGFLARDITFQNTAGPSKHQAVALRVGSDLSAFYRCNMIAYQDTLYVHSNRQFFISCYIAGTVDFIFGNAAAVLQNCDIHARRPNAGQKNMLTAQGRSDKNQNTGIVIQKCRIDTTSDLKAVKSSFPTYLGRPWKQYSRTVFMQSTIGDVIVPAGWYEWDGDFALSTLEYREYANTGAGAGTSGRVKWGGYKVITSATEAQQYTAGRFIGGSGWLSSTTFPFSLGL